MDYHVKIKGMGKPPNPRVPSKRIEGMCKFHRIAKALDSDWPFVINKSDRGSFWTQRECSVCGGRIYRLPKLGPQDLKALAKQLGFRIKIKQFLPETKCFPNGAAVRYKVLDVPKEIKV